VQAIPVIAEECAELTVFQRTAQYTVPARNEKLNPAKVRETKGRYKEFRDENFAMPAALGANLPQSKESVHEASEEDRSASFESWWESGGTSFMRSYADLILDESANVYAAEFVRSKIEDIVTDPETARKLSPEHIIGCKRLVIDSGYYETFNRPNVHLVDVSEASIERVTTEGLKTTDNAYEVDVLIFATGFDAMTGSILKVDIRGRSNLSIRDKWSAGPRTYLGLSVPGFPNMFMVSGPGSPSVLTNMIVSIQQHVEWISDCIAWMDETSHKTIEATVSAETNWVEHVNAIAHKTLFPSCNSWYLGANVPGKTRVFMPLLGFPGYVRRCDKVASENYDGFTLVTNS
jgi:cyclohexanone monooxygenase